VEWFQAIFVESGQFLRNIEARGCGSASLVGKEGADGTAGEAVNLSLTIIF
jgi:hypothetical protein